MSIEFHCTICHRLLRVPNGTSGRQARCPGCGGLLIVPAVEDASGAEASMPAGLAMPAGPIAPDGPGSTATPPTSPFAAGGEAPGSAFSGAPAGAGADSDNPYASPSAEAIDARPVYIDVCAYAASRVQTPAVGLIAAGALGLAGMIPATIALMFGVNRPLLPAGGVPLVALGSMFGWVVISAAVCVLLICGGLKMKRLENYSLALAASIVAIVPCWAYGCGCSLCLGVVFGIWGVVVLSNAQVRAAFALVAGRRAESR